MKRKICVVAAVFASSLFLTACGSKEYLKDIKADRGRNPCVIDQ